MLVRRPPVGVPLAAGPNPPMQCSESPGQSYWPNPNKEAFRRPLRTRQEVHLNDQKGDNPHFISHMRAKGYTIYFQDDYEEKENFLCLNNNYMVNFAHKNKFECLNDINDLKNNNDYMNIDCNDDKNITDCVCNDCNDNNDGVTWSNEVPESTKNACYKNKNKNTYPGYMCSIINPQNQSKKVNIKQKTNCNNKYNENYITKLQNRCMEIINKFYKSQSREKTCVSNKKTPRGRQKFNQVTGPNPSLGGLVTGQEISLKTNEYVTRENKNKYPPGSYQISKQLNSGHGDAPKKVNNIELRTPRNPTKIKPKKLFKERRKNVHKESP